MKKLLFTLFIVTIVFLGNYHPAKADIYTGLIAWWRFDNNDISGTTVTDRSKSGHDGTMVNTPSTGRGGQVGQSIEINGTSMYVQIPTASYAISTGFTVSCWVRTPISYSSSAGQCMAQDSFGDSKRVFQFRLTSGSVNFIRFDVSNGVITNISASKNVTDYKWHMITATFNNSIGSTIYIDGKAQISDSVLTNNNTANEIAAIGTRYDLSPQAEYFAGNIDDVRLYSRGLSAAEVNQLYISSLYQSNQF